MAWFKKEKKPKLPRREKHEIPPDAWEKCEVCGHTDIREKFERNLNVCPSCGFHRRIRAIQYAEILLDDGTLEETELDQVHRSARLSGIHRTPEESDQCCRRG